MKVELVSVGDILLMNDILDTNMAYVTRYLRDIQAELTCKVTVGEDATMLADVLQTALRRADAVLVIGPAIPDSAELMLAAVIQLIVAKTETAVSPASEIPFSGNNQNQTTDYLFETGNGTIICLPNDRREMAFLLDTEVVPYLRARTPASEQWKHALLRSIGIAASQIKEELADLVYGVRQRITFNSFAGQTDIQLWTTGTTPEDSQARLEKLRETVYARLGNYIFGEEDNRLEEVVARDLFVYNKPLMILECDSTIDLKTVLTRELSIPNIVTVTQTHVDLAQSLQLPLPPDDEWGNWCRQAANRLRQQENPDLLLMVFERILPGGIHIIVALASPNGVSISNRSFGGHPDNIQQWVINLTLSHLRRWLLGQKRITTEG